MPTIERQSGSVLESVKTILVAMLLGATGYLANVTLANHVSVVSLTTKFDERKANIDEMRRLLDHTVEVQQEMLQAHIKLSDKDEALDLRIRALEGKGKP